MTPSRSGGLPPWLLPDRAVSEIAIAHRLGLDHVSCSASRIQVASLAGSLPPPVSVATMEGIEQSVQRGIAAFRWLAWLWMATVLLLARRSLERPAMATLLVAAALLVTVWLTIRLDRAPATLTLPSTVGVEVGVALALQLADGFVYRTGHVFSGQQPLGVGWPLAAILASGVALGPGVGAGTGLLLGVGRAVTSVANVVQEPGAELYIGPLTPVQTLSLVTTTVLYALAGGIAGYAARLVRDAQTRVASAERALAEVRARDEVARRLHDGVLQTLAIVERRADDPQLAKLARDQERDLRAYLAGSPGSGVVGVGELGDVLRIAADRFETAFGIRVEVLVPDDLPTIHPEVLDVLGGAVGEALTNVGKHADATSVVVYVEPLDDGVFVSVRDDGRGVDPAEVVEGMGLPGSIRAPIEWIGGEVEWSSAPGRGTEVQLRVPAGSATDAGGSSPGA